MEVPADAQVVTADGAVVQLQIDGVSPITISSGREVSLDEDVATQTVDPAQAMVTQAAVTQSQALISALNEGQDPFAEVDPTAAVLGGGDSGGSSFTRLLSVIETTTPLALAYPRPGGPDRDDVRLPGGVGGSANTAPEATLLDPSALEQRNDDSETISPLDVGQYFRDADGDTLVFSAQGLPPGLTIDPVTGIISGTLDKSASQGGNNGVYTVIITATDSIGASTSITFPWTAVNPPPVAEDDTNTTEENTVVTGNVLTGKPGGEGKDADPDGDTITVTEVTNKDGVKVPAGSAITGDNGGQFVINPDGSYTFTPGKDFDYLADGEEVTTKVTYKISDGEGGFDTAELIITVTGTNDGPAIDNSGTNASASVTEIEDNVTGENATQHTREGVITFTDADASDTHTATFAPQAGDKPFLGKFELLGVNGADRTVDWKFTVDDADLDFLAAGETREQVYVVTVDDGKGGTVQQKVTVTITGTNDAPVIESAVDAAEIKELDVNDDTYVHQKGGDIVFSDVDLRDTHTVEHEPTGPNAGDYIGEFTIVGIDQDTNTVIWDFKVSDTALGSLGADDTLVQTYDVTISDGNGGTVTQQVTITIRGTNDAPVIDGSGTDASTSVTEIEDKAAGENTTEHTREGVITFTDADASDTHTATFAPKAGDKPFLGKFELLGVNGADRTVDWKFTVDDADLDFLAAGETREQVYVVTVDDGKGGTVTQEVKVTITGTNDAPIIESAVDSAEIKELDVNDDAYVHQKGGDIVFSDVDLKDTHTIEHEPTGPNAADYIGEFTIAGFDQATNTVVWDFKVSDAVLNALGADDTLVQTYDVTISDGNGGTVTQQVTITIRGTNDGPVIDGSGTDASASVTEIEDNAAGENTTEHTREGVITFTDADDSDTHTATFAPQVGDKPFLGKFELLGVNGADRTVDWKFTVDDADLDFLAAGETREQVYVVTVDDGKGGTVTQEVKVTITGTNDAPIIDAARTQAEGSIAELPDGHADENDHTHTADGDIVFSDVDLRDTHTVEHEPTGPNAGDYIGEFTIVGIDQDTNTVKWDFKVEDSVLDSLSEGETLTQTYDVTISDGNGGTVTQQVTITITGKNDAPLAVNDSETFVEDKPGAEVDGQPAFKGNVLDNDTNPESPLEVVSFTVDGVTVQLDGEPKEVSVKGGTFSLSPNGEYVFTPAPHFSGKVPTITYVVQEADSDNPGGETLTSEATLNITVVPDADAPIIAEIAPVKTDEDTQIALKLEAPKLVDYVDQNGSDAEGDNPERLGPITLEGIPEGVTLHWNGGSFEAKGEPITIILDESGPEYQHIKGASGTLTLTKEQYESLAVTPKANDGNNFDITVKVTSYEVDAEGNPLTGAPSGANYEATSEQKVTVDVRAVTDTVTLTFKDSVQSPASGTVELSHKVTGTTSSTGKSTLTVEDGSDKTLSLKGTVEEDTEINLKSLLDAAFQDLDGSEDRWVTITNTTGADILVNGKVLKPGQESEPFARGELGTKESGFGDIWVGGIKNASGESIINGKLKITLHAQDRDTDSEGGTSTNPYRAGKETDSVELNLDLTATPVIDGLQFGNVSTDEDTGVKFLADLKQLDADGSETITSLKIKVGSIPDGAVIKDGDMVLAQKVNGVLLDAAGNPLTDQEFFEILPGSGTMADQLAALQQYEIVPPAHSSKDFKLEFSYDVTDNGGAAGSVTDTKTGSVNVTVKPVAEIIPDPEGDQPISDTDGNNTPDLTMTEGHEYSEGVTATEDGWFNLNTDGFNLGAGWKNEDAKGEPNGSEDTFALLKPVLAEGVAGETAIGSQFRYTDADGKVHTLTYEGGDGVQIPIEYLHTVEFLPPRDVAGEFKIEVRARTVDTDPDDGTTVSADSGYAELKGIQVAPDADDVTLSVGGVDGRAQGNEDTFISLSIRPSSTDVSETFNVRIGDMPPGATLRYDGQEIDLDNLPAGMTLVTGNGKTWLQIDNFDQGKDLAIRPPHNSNDDFTLTVQAQSVDAVPGQDTDVSDWDEKPLPVRVKGVADDAELIIEEGKTYTEEALDGGGNSIALSDVIKGFSLHDQDGSEKLSIKITGLGEDFTIVGATFLGGEGAAREWIVTYDQLASGNVKVIVPEHFSGEVKAKVVPITTENDGDWKASDAQDLTITVTPSPESDAVASSTIVEDQSTRLSFGIAANHGDDNESLTKVFIKVSDVDGNPDFTLFLGDVELKDAGLAIEDGYYVLDKSQYENVHAKANPNFAHNTNGAGELKFGVKYEITDETNDGTGAPVTKVVEGEHALIVVPVTDQVQADLAEIGNGTAQGSLDGDTFTVTATGTINVGLTLQKTPDAAAGGHPDYDGSERMISVTVSGVPEGLNVNGVLIGGSLIGEISMIGDGVWLITLPQSALTAFDGGIDAAVQFEAGDYLSSNVQDHPISITVNTQDTGADKVESDSVTWKLTSELNGPGPREDVEISWKQKDDFKATEDEPFKLSDAFEGDLNHEADFSIVLELPPGSTVTHDGQPVEPKQVVGEDGSITEVWVINGSGDSDALQDLMDKVEITPPQDWNDGRGDSFDPVVKVNAHDKNGSHDQVGGPGNVPVLPVTDPAVIQVDLSAADNEGKPTDRAPEEGSAVAIEITVGTPNDGPSTLGDKLYVRVTESDLSGGKVFDAAGNELTPVTLAEGNDAGLPAGEYYVIDVPEGTQAPHSVQLQYQPGEDQEYKSGGITVESWITSQENGSSVVETGKGEAQADLAGVDNGYDITVGEQDESGAWVVGGGENQSGGVGEGHIPLTIGGEGLKDTDSEQLHAAFLKGLPPGFLVYVGENAESATQAVLADNAGNASGSMIWSIPLVDGKLPGYIAVVPPQNWSGTLEGVQMVVQSSEKGSTQPPKEDAADFKVQIEAKADGLISLSPNRAFGKEGEIVRLQLNAVMADGARAGDTDQSVETVTLTLRGLGEHAAFYVGDDRLLQDGVTYDAATDTYTITGLSQSDVDHLGFIQAAGAAQGKVHVTAQTVEEAGGDPSEVREGEFDLSLRDVLATGGDDVLLFDGKTLDAGAGDDTVWLRFGESLDFAAEGENAPELRNIETLDLTREGFDNELLNLGVDDVRGMTDDRNVLTIEADQGDKVSFKAEDGWVLNADKSTDEYDVYTSTRADAGDVEVRITKGFSAVEGILDEQGGSINGLLGAPAASAPAPAASEASFSIAAGEQNQLVNDLIQQGKLNTDI